VLRLLLRGGCAGCGAPGAPSRPLLAADPSSERADLRFYCENSAQQFSVIVTAASVEGVEAALVQLGLYDLKNLAFTSWRDDWRCVVSGQFNQNLWKEYRADDAGDDNKHGLWLCFGCHAASLWGPSERGARRSIFHCNLAQTKAKQAVPELEGWQSEVYFLSLYAGENRSCHPAMTIEEIDTRHQKTEKHEQISETMEIIEDHQEIDKNHPDIVENNGKIRENQKAANRHIYDFSSEMPQISCK
jgi:hypothetical protein